ncbi:carboxypeptidase-like regulatory domain-containing protein [Tamlana sp. s12]|uniref:carboxypeptidase-like regulatory domain-containing protein n=1 Tax=Tamlana sp. s12 TaxID=1630406 RepID=UPI0007FD947B|nr:carboxypeptidase-like regulatory domain-containing protein [Tamlana sp. s12]OBQ52878.1 hypothetical protein VQ01_13095 [Tamlana sp. s12]QQY81095.1 carboxypeptidase-like regulatory domain-containing protein [Tamlana sp. s12]
MIVKGRLTDTIGNPLPNAHIVIGANGTVADDDGTFEVEADGNEIAAFSYLGMETARMKVSEIQPIIILQDTATALDAVLVVGKNPLATKTPFYKTTAFKIGISVFILAIIYLASKKNKATGLSYIPVEM